MYATWFWVWFAVMFMVVIPWISYGWGYRRWGPPYPRYIQRRRGQGEASAGVYAPVRYDGWGWHGDAVWGVFLIATLWVVTSMLWWR